MKGNEKRKLNYDTKAIETKNSLKLANKKNMT